MATINGSAGNDTLLGGVDHDAINGLGGNDSLSGADGNDTLNGGAGNDKLVGGVENDLLLGDAGNDTLDGGLDDDTLKGGAGNDLYIVGSFFDVVEELPGGGKDTIRATVDYQLSDGQEIESFILDSDGEITGTGNGQGNLITMVGAGQALMWGLAGNDTLKGGIGDDALRGDAGDDIMAGGKGNDSYQIDSLADKISELAGQGRDLVISHLKDYTLGANFEDLTVNGLNGTGNTLKNFIMGGFAANILSGMGGNDTLWGGSDNDTLLGGAGDDTLDGEFGDDSMNGGAGNDHYVVSDAGDIVTEAKGGGTDTIETTLNNLTLVANVENLLLAGVASLNAAGNELANKMTGNAAQNILEGHAGDDTLDGGAGNDTLKGGAGNDLYLVDSFNDVVEDGVGGGKDTIRATSTYQLSDGQEIESLILDSSGEIGGIGNAQGNLITMVGGGKALMQGLAGNDTLTGGVGDDGLIGGEGNDIMAGGKGNDAYVVDSIGDKVSELAGQGYDSVNSFLMDYTLGANCERLLVNGFSGTGNALDNTIEANGLSNKLSGAAGNDLIFGRNGDDTIDGGTGHDLLIGGAGADSMTGGAGNDWYDAVDDAGDVIVELAGGGIDTVETNSDGHVLAANVENLALVGVAALSGTGNGLANALFGSFVGNVLSGEAGNDTLDGAGGNDTLKGGVGNDFYLIDSPLDVVVEGVGGGKDTVRATSTYQLSTGQEIEILIIDSSGEISGIGNGYGNLITMVGAGQAIMDGWAGNDTLKGGVGDDYLIGGEGNDVMAGGKGNDGYFIDSIADKVSELAGQGRDLVNSFLKDYTLGANFEDLQVNGLNGTGNALDNYLDANGLANKLSGAAGNDLIFGRDGDDTIDGGTGSDLLIGGAGNDRMTGGAGNDWYDAVDDAGDAIVELAGGGIDTVETNSNGHVLAANVENLALVGAGAISGMGNGLANALFGSFVGNVLSGEAGNDTLDGAGGNDTLKGGVGNDLYLVDNINDVVEEGIGGGKDTIRATFTYQLNDGQEIESFILDSSGVIGGFGNSQGNLITMVGTGPAAMFGNGGNDTLTGGVGSDELHGDAGKDILSGGGALDVLVGGEDSDTLKGGAGDDVLTGGLGADALFGEAGADRFIYSVDLAPQLATLGNDTITGFQKGIDKIDLRDLITDFGIDADDAFTDKYVILSKAGANTIVQFDQDGSAGGLDPVTLATVTSATVTAADLILETS